MSITKNVLSHARTLTLVRIHLTLLSSTYWFCPRKVAYRINCATNSLSYLLL